MQVICLVFCCVSFIFTMGFIVMPVRRFFAVISVMVVFLICGSAFGPSHADFPFDGSGDFAAYDPGDDVSYDTQDDTDTIVWAQQGGDIADRAPSSQSYAPYVLGVDDVLSIVVYGEEELSDTHKIAADGTIAVPLIGEVSLMGLTIREAEARLVALLADGYLVEPSVSIAVDEYRPFYILGEVRMPGPYSYVNGMSVLNAVAMAGGFTYRADQDEVKVLRGRGGQQVRHDDVPVDDGVMPGDIILVEERFF